MSPGSPAPSLAQSPQQVGETDPKLAVVIRHTGEADALLARDLQEVMVAALSDREGYLLVGKEELQAQANFKSENDMISCLVDTACEEELRTRQNIKVLLLGTIDKSETHYEFSVQLIRDTGGEYSKIFRVPQDEGLDGLLSRLFDIAAELPIDEGPIPVVVKDPKKPGDTTTPPPEDPKTSPPPALGPLGYVGIGGLTLSAATLGVAIFFNLDRESSVQTLQDEIDASTEVNGGAQGVTRARAKELEGDANDSAKRANLFYGLSFGAAVVGATLLTIDLLDDNAEANPGGQVRVSPWASEEGAGSALEFTW